MNAPTPLQPLNALRNLRIILCFNIPLIALYLLFDFWRAYIHGGGEVCTDFVCAFTELHGDAMPLVSSFTEEAHRRAASVNIALARELLHFNFIIFVAYVVIATIVLCFSIPRLGMIGSVKYRKSIYMLPLGVAMIAFLILLDVWTPRWPMPGERKSLPNRLIFDHWGGVYSFNLRSLFTSMFIMLMVVHVFNLVATLRYEFRKDA